MDWPLDTAQLIPPGSYNLAVSIAGKKFMEIIKTAIGSKLPFAHFGTKHLRVDGCNEIRLTSRRNDIHGNLHTYCKVASISTS